MTLSCAHVSTESQALGVIATTEAFKLFDGEFENTDYFLKHKPASVAVLPFDFAGAKAPAEENREKDPAEIVRRGFYNHLASLPFRDLELFAVDRQLKNAGLTDAAKAERLLSENPARIRSILGVDAAVTGRVTHFDRIFLGIYSQVAVGCDIKMWDLESGQLLWRAKHVSRAHAGGISINPIGLALAAVASVWNLREAEMLSQTDELFREVVSTIDVPRSALAVETPPPGIDLFTVVNADKPYTAGRKVALRLIGDPGCAAYADLGDFKSGIRLAPVPAAVKQALQAEVLEAIRKNTAEAGHQVTAELLAAVAQQLGSREIYEGAYTVEPQEEAYGLTAKGYLVNAAGIQRTAIDVAHTVAVDSRPPQPVETPRAEPLNGKVRVLWPAGREDDLTGYEIWTSSSPLSGYTPAATVERNEALIAGLANFSKIYIRIRALDRAGNQGPFGGCVEAVPLPEAGLLDLPQPGPALGGEIRDRILLTPDKNPYSVQSTLDLKPGGALYLAPGVELEFAPDTALVVAGGELLAYGSSERPVCFSSRAANGRTGAWRGVVLDAAGRTVLQHLTIKGAVVGLTIAESAPSITAAFVSDSSQAGLYLKQGARPQIVCSVFRDNGGQGAIVIEGDGVAPLIRNNIFVNNMPFQIQSYAPMKMNVSLNFWGAAEPQPEWFLGDVAWQPALSDPPGACAEFN